MINAYASLQSYEGDDWNDYLNKICLYEIFKDLFPAYPDTNTLKCVIKYIVWAYSPQSDKVILGMDWQKNKEQIFESANILPNQSLYNDLVLLQSAPVIKAITNWMDHLDSDTFKQMSLLKELRLEMQLSSVSKILKSNSEIDFDQKFKNAKYAVDLKIMIKDLESELIQNNTILKEAAKEVKVASKNKTTFGVETFSQ